MTVLEIVSISAFIVMAIVAMAAIHLLMKAREDRDEERLLLVKTLEGTTNALYADFPDAMETAVAIAWHVQGRQELNPAHLVRQLRNQARRKP